MGPTARYLLFSFPFLAFSLSAAPLLAATCAVAEQRQPSAADQALLKADYGKAEQLYQATLGANPQNRESTEGLVRSLLRDQKVQDAATVVDKALAARANVPWLITLRGEIEYREGEPWLAAQSADESVRRDPCNARTHLLRANLYWLNSLDASAHKEVLMAHALDPSDPEIRREWLEDLPLAQEIPELESYLSQPNGENAEELRNLGNFLDHLKKLQSEPHRGCELVSSTTATKIPIAPFRNPIRGVEGLGLPVRVNSHNVRLEIDTGASGLLVTNAFAHKAGLKPSSHEEIYGVGDEGSRDGFRAFADSIRIGDLEFKDCVVAVAPIADTLGDMDGLIGMNVLSDFLVTLNYPAHELQLETLPARPGETAAPAGLNTGAQTGNGNTSLPAFHDRYVAPQMRDYEAVYRVGDKLLLPTFIAGPKAGPLKKLFLLDTGSSGTIISSLAAREVSPLGYSSYTAEGMNGQVDRMYSAETITLRFANAEQKIYHALAMDMSNVSKDEGIEVSGFLGATTLEQMIVHIDYRDGLVKFEYEAKH